MLKRRFIITELVVQRGWPSINTGAGKRLRRAKKKDGTTTMLSNDWVGQTRICILNFVGGVQLRYLGSTYHPGTTATAKVFQGPGCFFLLRLPFKIIPQLLLVPLANGFHAEMAKVLKTSQDHFPFCRCGWKWPQCHDLHVLCANHFP